MELSTYICPQHIWGLCTITQQSERGVVQCTPAPPLTTKCWTVVALRCTNKHLDRYRYVQTHVRTYVRTDTRTYIRTYAAVNSQRKSQPAVLHPCMGPCKYICAYTYMHTGFSCGNHQTKIFLKYQTFRQLAAAFISVHAHPPTHSPLHTRTHVHTYVHTYLPVVVKHMMAPAFCE